MRKPECTSRKKPETYSPRNRFDDEYAHDEWISNRLNQRQRLPPLYRFGIQHIHGIQCIPIIAVFLGGGHGEILLVRLDVGPTKAIPRLSPGSYLVCLDDGWAVNKLTGLDLRTRILAYIHYAPRKHTHQR